jgi:hypothetical protein
LSFVFACAGAALPVVDGTRAEAGLSIELVSAISQRLSKGDLQQTVAAVARLEQMLQNVQWQVRGLTHKQLLNNVTDLRENFKKRRLEL